MRPHLVPPLATAALLLCLAPPAPACTCVPPTDFYAEYAASDAVFMGEVLELSHEVSPDPPYSYSWATIRVERGWKGEPPVVARVLTAAYGAACGYEFRVGTRYLVYASDRAGLLTVSLCSRTHETWPGDPDLTLLESPHRIEMSLVATPNPSRGQMRLTWTVPNEAHLASMRLDVLDLQGRRVKTLAREEAAGLGPREALWDWRDESGHTAPAGIYAVRLACGDQVMVRKVVRLERP